MSKTVAQASADYRKRKADKLARYEKALGQIAHNMVADPSQTAWEAVYGDLRNQLTASLREIAK